MLTEETACTMIGTLNVTFVVSQWLLRPPGCAMYFFVSTVGFLVCLCSAVKTVEVLQYFKQNNDLVLMIN